MILLTGAAGFIGYHTALSLLERGEQVIGIDNVNDYYDIALKQARLSQLEEKQGFQFHQINIADKEAVHDLMAQHPEIDSIIHLAAQAGVRHSLIDPYAYEQSNLAGQLVMLEAARHCKNLKHFVYASSSSVYGGNEKQPFSIDDPIEKPVSLFARATLFWITSPPVPLAPIPNRLFAVKKLLSIFTSSALRINIPTAEDPRTVNPAMRTPSEPTPIALTVAPFLRDFSASMMVLAAPEPISKTSAGILG